MYQFISERFIGTSANIQKQALQWLQVNEFQTNLNDDMPRKKSFFNCINFFQKLCLLNIHIPLDILFEMFNNGMEALQLHGQTNIGLTNGEKLEIVSCFQLSSQLEQKL